MRETRSGENLNRGPSLGGPSPNVITLDASGRYRNTKSRLPRRFIDSFSAKM
jgi:hypothetical protein